MKSVQTLEEKNSNLQVTFYLHNLTHEEKLSNLLCNYRGQLHYINFVYTMPTLNCTVPQILCSDLPEEFPDLATL